MSVRSQQCQDGWEGTPEVGAHWAKAINVLWEDAQMPQARPLLQDLTHPGSNEQLQVKTFGRRTTGNGLEPPRATTCRRERGGRVPYSEGVLRKDD